MPLTMILVDSFIREIQQDIKTDLRWRRDALKAVHEAAETYMHRLLNRANLLAIHAKRTTLMRPDLELIQELDDLATGCFQGKK